MRSTKSIQFKGRKKIAIIVDGECEFWYVQMIKRNNRELSVDLKPEIPQRKKLQDQFDKVIGYSEEYYKVIWIVDLDVITAETRKAKKGAQTAMQEFEKYLVLLKQKNNIQVIVNNPCLEFWLLLHYEATGKYFNDCEGAAKQLKTHLSAYEKTERFYTKKDNDIFLKMKPLLKDAIVNAGKLPAFSAANPSRGFSGMNDFFNLPEIKGIL